MRFSFWHRFEGLTTCGDFLEDFDAVRDGVHHELEAFDGAARFSWEAEDESFVDDGGEVAGEDGILGDLHRFHAHDFAEARQFPDGDFADGNEWEEIESGAATLTNAADLTLDPTGRIAYAYALDAGGGSFDVRVAYDRSDDGDFDDIVSGNPELVTVRNVTIGTGGSLCIGTAFDDSGNLHLIFSDNNDFF